MMTFLALAAKMSWPVIGYKDNAIATLGIQKDNVSKIEWNFHFGEF